MKKVVFFLALMVVGMMAVAQNPYLAMANNEDEVVKIEQWQSHAAVPLQAIVKLQDYSNYTISGKPGKSGAAGRVLCPAIEAVLGAYTIESVEQLCPTFVMPDRPRRAASYGGGEVTDHDLSQMYLITLSQESPKREYELIAELSALDEVEYAEPNYMAYALDVTEFSELKVENQSDATNYSPVIPEETSKGGAKYLITDPLYIANEQWGFLATNLNSLLNMPKRNSSWRPIIAIVDTGVDTDHPDLSANIWTNTAEQNGAANQDDDGNGLRDDVHGWDFVNQTANMHDFNGHGTHCAGLAGAVTNNGKGIAGACPDAWIMPVAVMQSDGTGNIATIIQGINYAAQNGADVISMSIGTYAYSTAMEQALAVAYQTAVLVAAAGNDALHIDPRCCPDASHKLFDGPMFPAAFTFVLGVQSTNQLNELASFSNIDCDGPSYSQYDEEKLYNYEISAPGVGIISTVPGGNYRFLNGTSMACPLVAGGVASLLQRKDYATKEILFGDLINRSPEHQHVNFYNAYTAPNPAPAILEMVTFELNDTLYGDSSMYADAGERVQIYPTIRTVWGPTSNVELWLEFQPYEDQSTIQILQNHVQLGHSLSAYSKAKSVNPIDIQIANNVVDGRHIQLTLCASSPDANEVLRQNFTLQVTNGMKLHGVFQGNHTLYPDVQYIVTSNLAMPEGDTLFIKPGTTIKVKEGVSINATIVAIGKPDSMITFTKADLSNSWGRIVSKGGLFDYCIFEYTNGNGSNNFATLHNVRRVDNSIIRNVVYDAHWGALIFDHSSGDEGCSRLCIYDYPWNYNITHYSGIGFGPIIHSNIINNYGYYNADWCRAALQSNSDKRFLHHCNVFNNTPYDIEAHENFYIDLMDTIYWGSTMESIIRKHVYDLETPGSDVMGWVDLSNMASRPFSEAHGIVWKVEVNGYDAQDEFDQIIPLGVGTHEFKVYFNRAMDTNITPIVAMGVRPPYTQTAISENASWSADSTIYTTHVTLTGRSAIDGLNRIYVSGAQDDEHFEIPYENKRFNVYVASSGSMSAGFQATAGIGKVDLEWNDQEVNVDDFLGFNLYRYNYDSLLTNRHWDSERSQYVYDTVYMPVDTIRLNQALLQDTMYTDYDVVPGKRYFYYYKILSTSLTENSPSTTVSCVPNSTIPGDANGSYGVDVVDVIQVINYVTGQNPQPFLFDAADVNGDGEINVLDIVAIINIILHPGTKDNYNGEQYTAIYTIENDTLYINTPVELAGLQFAIGGCTTADIEVLPALGGFESVSAQNGDELMMLFYSMAGATVPAGKTALLRIGAGELTSVVAGDPQGHNLIMLYGDPLGLVDIDAVQAQFATAYPNPFSGLVHLDLTVGNYSNVSIVFTDMMGRQVDRRDVATPTAGRYSLGWDAQSLPRGVYFATLYADGQKAQTIKLIVK